MQLEWQLKNSPPPLLDQNPCMCQLTACCISCARVMRAAPCIALHVVCVCVCVCWMVVAAEKNALEEAAARARPRKRHPCFTGLCLCVMHPFTPSFVVLLHFKIKSSVCGREGGGSSSFPSPPSAAANGNTVVMCGCLCLFVCLCVRVCVCAFASPSPFDKGGCGECASKSGRAAATHC